MSLARYITYQLRGRWLGRYGSVCCPVHDDRAPSMSICDRGDSDVLVHCFAGCDWRDIKEELMRRGMLERFSYRDGTNQPNAQHYRKLFPIERPSRFAASQKTAWCKRIWDAAEKVEGSPVEHYLRSRGMSEFPASIRCHRGLRDTDTKELYPCMVAAITRWPTSDLIGIHRTFLTASGLSKAPIRSQKKMLGECRGGAVHLSEHGDVLAVAEGIETALSVQIAMGMPTWAALSAGGLRSLLLPTTLKELVIFADHDEVGIDAARDLADRYFNQIGRVRIAIPPERGADFNDIFLGA